MSMNLTIEMALRAMKSAARQGFSPYDSHTAQSAKWKKAWADKARREALKEAKLAAYIPSYLR